MEFNSAQLMKQTLFSKPSYRQFLWQKSCDVLVGCTRGFVGCATAGCRCFVITQDHTGKPITCDEMFGTDVSLPFKIQNKIHKPFPVCCGRVPKSSLGTLLVDYMYISHFVPF